MENNQVSFYERFYVSIKIFTIGLLMLILLIPLGMIKSLINEREVSQMDAINEVSSKWGIEQTITGPYLTIPYKYSYKQDNKLIEGKEYVHFLPDNLTINGRISSEQRSRGIYEIVVYNSKLNMNGSFLFPDFNDLNIEKNNIMWEDASISVGITDLRGIKKMVRLNLIKEQKIFEAGLPDDDITSSGINAKININNFKTNEIVPFLFELDLNGSGALNFIPVGKETKVELASDWESPSFIGAFLPEQKKLSENGFTARWVILQLNRNFPQKWIGDKHNVNGSNFGVNLFLPVDRYQKTMRSAKYAILLISLTFLAFFFIETINRKKIHPIQYILVGLGLCLFYSILLSLSEHIAFGLSYLIASTGIIAMISLFSHSIYKNMRLTLISFAILAILYFYIYTLIRLQDFALLMGSIGLFIILSIIMYLSRKIDWYAVGVKKNEG